MSCEKFQTNPAFIPTLQCTQHFELWHIVQHKDYGKLSTHDFSYPVWHKHATNGIAYGESMCMGHLDDEILLCTLR